MKTTWQWSIESEANRLIQTCTNIANGFYKLNGFYPLPSSEKNLLPHGVYIPRIAYQTIPDFWLKCATTDLSVLPVADPHMLTDKLSNLLSSTSIAQPDTSVQGDWLQISDRFWSTLSQIMPNHITKNISSVTIYQTNFGTSGSFNRITTKNRNITIWIRSDRSTTTVAEMILSSILKNELFDNHLASWAESEIVIDWLLHDTQLNTLYPNYLGTLHKIRQKVDQKIVTESNTFLSEINAPTFDKPFQVNKGHPHFSGRYIHNLTEREKKLLTSLIECAPSTFSYDQMADQIFATDDLFSLATMSKVIDRLRTKLERNGISKAYIATDRNQGYFLKN